MPELHDLSPTQGSHRNRKRVGRGPGSGKGKTSGRGENGQGSRSGGRVRRGFEGGQMPLQRRIPKRGFTNIHRVEFQVVNVRDLTRIEPGEVTPEILYAHGLVRKLNQPVKILGTGELEGAYQISVHKFSGSARTKIEAAGGTATVLVRAAAPEEAPDAAEAASKEPAPEAEEPALEAAEVPALEAEVAEETPAPEGDEASEAEEEQA
jgi:large subunit ribosomal protein L15